MKKNISIIIVSLCFCVLAQEQYMIPGNIINLNWKPSKKHNEKYLLYWKYYDSAYSKWNFCSETNNPKIIIRNMPYWKNIMFGLKYINGSDTSELHTTIDHCHTSKGQGEEGFYFMCIPPPPPLDRDHIVRVAKK
jgi:hypothetical protein